MAEVKLFGLKRFNPFRIRVELALVMKGVEHECIEEDLTNKSPLFLQYNPVDQKTPVLVHNGNTIADSLVIIEYIDETFDGPAILPKDPRERAKARFLCRFLDDKCEAGMRKACLSKGEEKMKATEELIGQLKILEDELNGKEFFGGDTVGIVDIAATILGFWFPIIEQLVGSEILTEDSFPSLCKWVEAFGFEKKEGSGLALFNYLKYLGLFS